MAYYHKPMTQRASSSAFAWGSIVFTEYATGCLRKILIQSKGYSKDIDPKYGIVGKINEDRHEARLIRERVPGETFVREARCQADLFKGVQLSGHADFVRYYGSDVLGVDELKSVTSKNTRRKIRAGQYLTENLAQLCAYMSAFKTVSGRLIYTYYEPVGDEWAPLEERIFAVHIDEFGRILVDSKPTKFTIHDLYAHQRAAALAIADNTVALRPHNWDAPFVSPCQFCAFKEACSAYDSRVIEGADAFVSLAIESSKECQK
jgi:hypothetical protein